MTTKRGRERAVRIAELKAQLSKHLRSAQRGEIITVLDREMPIARIVPIERDGDRLITSPATVDWKDIEPPRHVPIGVDVVALLLEDRRRR